MQISSSPCVVGVVAPSGQGVCASWMPAPGAGAGGTGILSGVGGGRQVPRRFCVPSTTPVCGAPPRIHFHTASRCSCESALKPPLGIAVPGSTANCMLGKVFAASLM